MENVRGLFGLDDASDEAANLVWDTTVWHDSDLPPPLGGLDADEPTTERENIPEDGSLLETAVPPAVVASSPTAPEVQATLPATQEETLQEIGRRLAHSERVIRLLQQLRDEMLPITRRLVPHTPELAPITAQDVEAIANAYLEDELSDQERGALGLLGSGMAEAPAVTAEEAEIDRTLWRLHVD